MYFVPKWTNRRSDTSGKHPSVVGDSSRLHAVQPEDSRLHTLCRENLNLAPVSVALPGCGIPILRSSEL